jgi:antitoxin StbD
MKVLLANCSVSISELKRNPSAVIKKSGGEAVAILNHNSPTAYLIPAETYEELLERLEDYQLGLIVKKRQSEKIKAIEVDIDEL